MGKQQIWIAVLLLLNAGAPDFCFAAPGYKEVRALYAASDVFLLDRRGDVIHELRVNNHIRRLEWIPLEAVSPAMIKAVVESEDKRFYDHGGIDWLALSSAAMKNIFLRANRGASTITMQLASLLDERLHPKKGSRSLRQKWQQMRTAGEIELSWTKDQILESYLNLVSFRGELAGISAASWAIFNKAPAGLDDAESAILAALIRSPNAAPEKVGARAAALFASHHGAVASEQVRGLAVRALSRPLRVRHRIGIARHAAERLLKQGSRTAVATIDGRVQRFAVEALDKALADLKGRNVRDGAVLVADNKTGDVLAYVGNSGKLSSAPYVDGVQTKRQAGSTLKPFLYALAVEQKIVTAASLIEDSPLDLPTGRGVYRPENYDRNFRGAVTVRTALASSLNIPAVKTLGLVGQEAFVGKLRTLGFSYLADAESYGPSLALGSADVSLWDLVNAYRTLANKGVWSPLRLSLSDEEKALRRRVFSEQAAFIISDILSDREARSTTFSLESPLSTRFWTAVKTGTSKDMRDNWCVGYSDRYTVGIWVGNFSGEPMHDVSGVSGAAPLWLEIMTFLHKDKSVAAPKQPYGVVQRYVRYEEGSKRLYERKEWFISGTEEVMIQRTGIMERPKIHYPASGTIIALDPDIPQEVQRIFFEATQFSTLLLDGEMLFSASWLPVPGMHRLQLIARDGSIADEVSFEVR